MLSPLKRAKRATLFYQTDLERAKRPQARLEQNLLSKLVPQAPGRA